MPADVAFQVENLAKLNRTLKALGDEDTPKAVKDANRHAAELIVREALRHAPVRTGRLAESVRALATATSARMKAGGARVPYAPAVHWGTGPRPGKRGPHNIRRRAFLWDAREKLATEVRDQYEKELEAVVNRLARNR